MKFRRLYIRLLEEGEFVDHGLVISGHNTNAGFIGFSNLSTLSAHSVALQ